MFKGEVRVERDDWKSQEESTEDLRGLRVSSSVMFLLVPHLRGQPSPAPVVELPEEGGGGAGTDEVCAAHQHQGSVVETSQAAHRHPGRA